MIKLDKLAIDFGTDKSSKFHNYTKYYEDKFLDKKDSNINLLEIGVYNGSSLRMWKTYFHKANIYGIDINPDCKKHEEERVNIHIGSQIDEIFLKDVVQKIKKIDIIIDDGSHINDFTVKTFNTLFPLLQSGGIYVIEDLHCCYQALKDYNVKKIWPGMNYNKEDIDNNDPIIIYSFISELFNRLNNENKTKDIESIEIYSKIMFIKKK